MLAQQQLPKQAALRVPFGVRDGRLHEPLHVEPGLRCNCMCPGCGGALVAKHGASGKHRPHFAHTAGADCATGFETAVHLAAKQLIAERGEIFLAELVAQSGIHVPTVSPARHRRLIHRAGLVQLSNVRVEQPLPGMRPDLLATTADGELLIEVAVTHLVDDEKLRRIAANGMAAVEFNLAGMQHVDFAALEAALFSDTSCCAWLFHPHYAAALAAVDAAAQADLARVTAAREQQLAQQQAQQEEQRQQAMAQADQQRQQQRLRQRQLAREQEVAAAELAAAQYRSMTREKRAIFKGLSNPERLQVAMRYMGIKSWTVPEFLRQEVPGADIVAAPADVWQSTLFASLIHTGPMRQVHTLTTEQAWRWVSSRFEVRLDRARPEWVVRDFLCGLASRGILERLDKDSFAIMAAGAAAAIELATDTEFTGHRVLHWRPSAQWPSRSHCEHTARAYTEAYGGSALWWRLARLAFTVQIKEEPMATADHYLHSTLRLQGVRRRIDLASVRRYLLGTGFVMSPLSDIRPK